MPFITENCRKAPAFLKESAKAQEAGGYKATISRSMA